MSAPTPSLRGLPGLYPEQAAGLIAWAIVRKPRVIAPWWLTPVELLGVLFRRPVEWALGAFYRRSADSPGAMGLNAVPPPRTPGLRRAFRTAGLLPLKPGNLVRLARAVLVQGGRPSSLCAMTARRVPDQPAVIDEAGAVTYGALQERVGRLAASLAARFGVGPGGGVGVMCRNHRGFVEAVLAASATGADAVLVNTEFPGPQLAQVLGHHRLDCLIHDAEFAPAVAQSGYGGNRVVADGSTDGACLDGLIDSAPGPSAGARRGGKIVILTSGTTGVPKGAARRPRFRSQSGPLRTLLTRLPFRAGGTILVAPPLFHGMGFAYLNLALFLGAAVVVRRRFDPAAVLADVARHRVSVLVAVPALLQRLLDVPESVRSGFDLSPLRAVLTSGAALGADLGGRFLTAFGPILYNLYGSSETGFGAIATPADLLAAPGTVGYPPAGTTVRVLGPDGRPTTAGVVGRVFLKTGLAFTGYVGGGTKEVIDGFMSTGDLGHLDAAGRLFVDGRADDMIVSGGENVFPAEVEAALAAHPDVAEAAVVGVPDAEFGQRLRAFVAARPGAAVGEAELRVYLKEPARPVQAAARLRVPGATAAERAGQGAPARAGPGRTGRCGRRRTGVTGIVAHCGIAAAELVSFGDRRAYGWRVTGGNSGSFSSSPCLCWRGAMTACRRFAGSAAPTWRSSSLSPTRPLAVPVPGARVEVQSEGGLYEERDKQEFVLVAGADGLARRECLHSMCFGTRSGLGFTNTFVVHLPWWRYRVVSEHYGPTEWSDLDVPDQRRQVRRAGPRQCQAGRARVAARKARRTSRCSRPRPQVAVRRCVARRRAAFGRTRPHRLTTPGHAHPDSGPGLAALPLRPGRIRSRA